MDLLQRVYCLFLLLLTCSSFSGPLKVVTYCSDDIGTCYRMVQINIEISQWFKMFLASETILAGEIFTDDYDQQWYFDTDVSLTIGPTSTGIDRTGFPLSYLGTYQTAYEKADPGCINSSSSSICCSGQNTSFSLQHNITQYSAFSIGPGHEDFMLLVTAQQSNSADITINVDPTVATPQSVPGISCTAHIDNRPNYEDRQVGEDVLFIDSTNRLDQGFLVPTHALSINQSNSLGMLPAAWMNCFQCEFPGHCTSVMGGSSYDQLSLFRNRTLAMVVSNDNVKCAFLPGYPFSYVNPIGSPLTTGLQSVTCTYTNSTLFLNVLIDAKVYNLQRYQLEAAVELIGYNVSYENVSGHELLATVLTRNSGLLNGTFRLSAVQCCTYDDHQRTYCNGQNIVATSSPYVLLMPNETTNLESHLLLQNNSLTGGCDYKVVDIDQNIYFYAYLAFSTARENASQSSQSIISPSSTPIPKQGIVEFTISFVGVQAAQLNEQVFSISYRYRVASAAGVGFEMVDILNISLTGGLALLTRVQFPGSDCQDDVEDFVASLQKNASAVLYESTYFQRFQSIEVTNISVFFLNISMTANPAISPAASPTPKPTIVVPPIMSPHYNGMDYFGCPTGLPLPDCGPLATLVAPCMCKCIISMVLAYPNDTTTKPCYGDIIDGNEKRRWSWWFTYTDVKIFAVSFVFLGSFLYATWWGMKG